MKPIRQPVAPVLRPQGARLASSLGGFTLVEMMVVIVLIGILTAAIIPEMKGTLDDARLRATSRELINVFHLAYSRAVTVGQVHRVRLDEKSGRYVLERSLRDSGREHEFVPVKDLPGGQGDLDPLITLSLRRPGDESPESPPPTTGPAVSEPNIERAVVFYPDGTADRTEILLEDRSGFRLVLRLNPTTARVQVVEPGEDTASAPPASREEAVP